MILKSYEIKKINLNISNLVLFYGKNEGLKKEALNILIKDKNNISNYEEKEILDNENNFIENISSKSLFEIEKFFHSFWEKESLFSKKLISAFFKIDGNSFFENLDKMLILKLNKRVFFSNFNIILFPTISELLLKKGKNNIG